MYDAGPSDSQLLAFGISKADIPVTIIEVWPDNWPAFEVMCAMGTQWRTGALGATGLDYAALPAVMRLLSIPQKHRSRTFHDIQWMEAEALSQMADARATKS